MNGKYYSYLPKMNKIKKSKKNGVKFEGETCIKIHEYY